VAPVFVQVTRHDKLHISAANHAQYFATLGYSLCKIWDKVPKCQTILNTDLTVGGRHPL